MKNIVIVGGTVLMLVCTGILQAGTGTVKARETHQTMVGFGASAVYYDNWLTAHPNKPEMYDYMFSDLGLDILRIKNVYRSGITDITSSSTPEIVNAMRDRSQNTPIIIMSSWSPPANIKSNNNVNGGGGATLKKNPASGKYMYAEFAQYWIDALNAYQSAGIVPDYISIQNEPSFDVTYESCIFNSTESATVAGYDQALDSVYSAFQRANVTSKILGPEVHGIGYGIFNNYGGRLNKNHLDGYNYHLYNGESDNVNDNHNPDLFNTNVSAIATNYPGKPIFQTEYDRGDWFNTVWLMHNCLVNGNVSGYLWWGLIYDKNNGKALVALENPWSPGSWPAGSRGYTLTPYYWGFRQFSKYIDPGWVRVTASVDVDSLKISAFVSPDGTSLTVVVINIAKTLRSFTPNVQDFTITDGAVTRSSDTEQGVDVLPSYLGTTPLDFPPRSITTLSFGGQLTSSIEDRGTNPDRFSLRQNYPNPFNPTTTIDYTLARDGYVQIKVFDVLGREVRTLVRGKMTAGNHSVQFDATDLNSGIYLYRIEAGPFTQSKKMILIK